MATTFAWRCQRCRALLAGNPASCNRCGHTVYDPVPRDEAKAEDPTIRKPCQVDLVVIQRTSCRLPDGHDGGHEYPGRA
jgi:hypothetical protein